MKLLVCGSRSVHSYRGIVWAELDKYMYRKDTLIIVEGACPNSADVWAEEKARFEGVEFIPFPSTSGNYLQRNIEMVEQADEVLAFFDNFSYGTSHTIATAVRLGKPVKVIDISRGKI